MERIWSTQISAHVGERVCLQGWLHRLRQLSNLSFLILRDAQGLAQIVVEDAALIEQLAGMHPETVLTVTGTVVAEAQAPNGVEVHQPAIEVLAEAAAPPPFDLFRPTVNAQLPTFLDHAPIGLRHPRQRALFRIASASMAGFRAALMVRDFTEIQTPKIVGAATEGGANVFKIDYFGQPAYLSQSPQLYKQIMVGVFERVFEIGPAFRAEPHDTPRHINEFVSLDVELGFIRDHTTVMEVLNRVLEGMIGAIQEQAADALALLGAKRGAPLELPPVPQRIPVLHFADALDLFSRATGEDAHGEPDLANCQARVLYPPRPRSAGLLTRLRPAVPWAGARIGRAAIASLWRLSGSAGRAGHEPGLVRGLPGGVQARHAAAWRLRNWLGALGSAAGRGAEYSRDHAVPARLEPPNTIDRSFES